MAEQDMQLQIAIEQGKVNALRQEVAEMNKEREYWNQVRIQLICAALTGLLANPASILNRESIVEAVMKIADAIVAELKKGGEQ